MLAYLGERSADGRDDDDIVGGVDEEAGLAEAGEGVGDGGGHFADCGMDKLDKCEEMDSRGI